ncbi:hypothetical protein [Muribacter muris]|uniref:hypothetical protein n=1 Tax=Muribacter muris TaxID=67855 RepID=UPI00069CC3F1|nr:hypothetical protein [Muribacter muris]
MKAIIFILTAIFVSMCGFILHVAIVEWLDPYLQSQLSDIQTVPSWEVKYLAALTSIETGIGMTFLYLLLKQTLSGRSVLVRGTIMAVIELAIMGRLIRQPLMDYAIGNPLYIAILQNMSSWIVWWVMGLATTLVYDFLFAKYIANKITN